MKVKAWSPEMSDKETAELAYWERNMLALLFADGWYYDDVTFLPDCEHEGGYVEIGTNALVCRECDEAEEQHRPRYQGWRRVLTLDEGTITFHIPDDFDVGTLPMVERNWDGHTTEEKWLRVAQRCGIEVPET